MAPISAANILDARREDLNRFNHTKEEEPVDEQETLYEPEGFVVPEPAPEYPPMIIKDVIQWCFKGESPIGRLDVLSRFGPLVDGQLRAGFYKWESAMSETAICEMVRNEHTTHWKKLMPTREYFEDIVPLTLGVHKGKSLYTKQDLLDIVQRAADEDATGDDAPLEFANLQKVVANHRRRRFRSAHSMIQQGGLLGGSPEVFIKKVQDQAKLPKPKELTMAEKIDREVAKNGGQVMMHRKTAPRTQLKADPEPPSPESVTREVPEPASVGCKPKGTGRNTENWYGIRRPSGGAVPNMGTA